MTDLYIVQERVRVFEAEITRLKTRIAAQGDDEDLMNFFFKSSGEDLTYVNDLKNRLAYVMLTCDVLFLILTLSLFSDAEERLKAMGQFTASEAGLKKQLAATTKKLDEYKSVFGEALSALPPDVQALSEQLLQKEKEIQRLQLLEKQHEQVGLLIRLRDILGWYLPCFVLG